MPFFLLSLPRFQRALFPFLSRRRAFHLEKDSLTFESQPFFFIAKFSFFSSDSTSLGFMKLKIRFESVFPLIIMACSTDFCFRIDRRLATHHTNIFVGVIFSFRRLSMPPKIHQYNNRQNRQQNRKPQLIHVFSFSNCKIVFRMKNYG